MNELFGVLCCVLRRKILGLHSNCILDPNPGSAPETLLTNLHSLLLLIQIPNAMVRPHLSFCNQRHINILNITAITRLFAATDSQARRHAHSDAQQEHPASTPGPVPPSGTEEPLDPAVNYFYHLLKSLNQLREELNRWVESMGGGPAGRTWRGYFSFLAQTNFTVFGKLPYFFACYY